MPPTGDLACNQGMCPDWESNLRPFGSQAGTQSTEPHHPGIDEELLKIDGKGRKIGQKIEEIIHKKWYKNGH